MSHHKCCEVIRESLAFQEFALGAGNVFTIFKSSFPVDLSFSMYFTSTTPSVVVTFKDENDNPIETFTSNRQFFLMVKNVSKIELFTTSSTKVKPIITTNYCIYCRDEYDTKK
jgi:hypothetical protein